MLRIAVEKGNKELTLNISTATTAVSTIKNDSNGEKFYDLGGRRINGNSKSIKIGKGKKSLSIK